MTKYVVIAVVWTLAGWVIAWVFGSAAKMGAVEDTNEKAGHEDRLND